MDFFFSNDTLTNTLKAVRCYFRLRGFCPEFMERFYRKCNISLFEKQQQQQQTVRSDYISYFWDNLSFLKRFRDESEQN